MKAGKITAKLRDAIKVCFMVEGEEVKRYKNIEMPDALKELEIRNFRFNVQTDGKIEFWLNFDQGICPRNVQIAENVKPVWTRGRCRRWQ